ncbi:aspartate aminotransferase family protein [Aetokthonos hydrillicola Thurmond2011]|jgi:glutamate-1-semialdehyde aminotransferase|uniref:Aspartate aminotransferase family protein n=2 Tax=Aetokthonos TaxID=1550243 RepID=A0AAP5M9E2_9CYAN|nr:aspartate aminotransferase family protein [Aetokthonos hydrillicola]MBO3458508.1 aspartate aminotransferase family protein [Aetokthonos hydrillicola CCALA 1050]MBW4584952.1 aspartate aminotransferase family protein [Aetokthonos hydrillicola CCALA 1050]MDR9894289.1 aspartate aminotransferase family protein [Aetokthonos hydrillicola Thurmond2011]
MSNPVIIKYLATFIEQYNQRTKRSKLLKKNHHFALADTENSVRRKFSLALKEMYYPIVINRSQGSRVWDVDDNEYVDIRMGMGSHLFGYNPPFIQEAVEKQLEKGIQVGLQPECVGEVAELICELTGMERVTFSNTGTEAVMTAIRLARTVRGRDKIVIFSNSYHGHFDAGLVKAEFINGNLSTVPIAPGITPNSVKDVLVLDYGNFQSLEVIKAHEQELAAVLVVPVQNYKPAFQPKAFLQQLRQLTQELGIALIIDEMATGFRIHLGGAQAYFGIKADIATYGKVIGGGMPIGVIAGKAVYMDAVDGGMWDYEDDSYPSAKTTFVAGTFCKHSLAMAAAQAVLKHLKVEGPTLQEQLNQRTTQFVEDLNSYLQEHEFPIKLEHFGSGFVFAHSSNSNTIEDPASDLGKELFRYSLLSKGVHLAGTCSYLSTAHTDEDISHISRAVKDSLAELREAGFVPFYSYSQSSQKQSKEYSVQI